jgi:hypothetical protein
MNWKLYLLICLPFTASSAANTTVGVKPDGVSVTGISITVDYHAESLYFTIHNDGDEDVMVLNDFCFDPHMITAVIDGHYWGRLLGGFSNGITRMGTVMAVVGSHGGQRSCEITYFPDTKIKQDGSGYGLIVWSTNLFVGASSGGLATKNLSGVIPVTLPIGSSNSGFAGQIDDVALMAFKHRNGMGGTIK